MRRNKKPDPIVLTSPKRQGGQIGGKQLLLPAAGAFLGNLVVPGIGGLLAGGIVGGALSLDYKEKKMARVPIFYSFHFSNDVMRVQQIRNIGSIEGNSPVSPNEWERLKRSGDRAVQTWIDNNMKYKRCVVVLIGSETASRPWVRYEIERAWSQGKALLGIHIHNIRCPRGGTSRKGRNPFEEFTFQDGSKLSSFVPCHDPSPSGAYRDISVNIEKWINSAIANKRN